MDFGYLLKFNDVVNSGKICKFSNFALFSFALFVAATKFKLFFAKVLEKLILGKMAIRRTASHIILWTHIKSVQEINILS